jgi:hypothetical protein
LQLEIRFSNRRADTRNSATPQTSELRHRRAAVLAQIRLNPLPLRLLVRLTVIRQQKLRPVGIEAAHVFDGLDFVERVLGAASNVPAVGLALFGLLAPCAAPIAVRRSCKARSLAASSTSNCRFCSA